MSTTNPYTPERKDLTSQQERILINLNQPRSLLSLAKLLVSDRYSPWYQPSGVLTKETLDEIASELSFLEEHLDLARNLGRFVAPSEVIEAIETDDDVPNLHPEKAENLAQLLRGRPQLLDEGEFYYHTEKGLSLLAGPVATRVIGGLRNGKPLDEQPKKSTARARKS